MVYLLVTTTLWVLQLNLPPLSNVSVNSSTTLNGNGLKFQRFIMSTHKQRTGIAIVDDINKCEIQNVNTLGN